MPIVVVQCDGTVRDCGGEGSKREEKERRERKERSLVSFIIYIWPVTVCVSLEHEPLPNLNVLFEVLFLS